MKLVYDMVIAWEQRDHDFARKMAISNEQYQNVECVSDMFRSDVVYIYLYTQHPKNQKNSKL